MKKILKFYSPTCGPCKVVSKNLAAIDNAEIINVDISDSNNEEMLNKWNIMTVPTVVVLNEAEELIKEFKGIFTIDKIKELL